MKISDNIFFKEIIENATTSQDCDTNFSLLLEAALVDSLVNDQEEFVEQLNNLILKELGLLI